MDYFEIRDNFNIDLIICILHIYLIDLLSLIISITLNVSERMVYHGQSLNKVIAEP